MNLLCLMVRGRHEVVRTVDRILAACQLSSRANAMSIRLLKVGLAAYKVPATAVAVACKHELRFHRSTGYAASCPVFKSILPPVPTLEILRADRRLLPGVDDGDVGRGTT